MMRNVNGISKWTIEWKKLPYPELISVPGGGGGVGGGGGEGVRVGVW